MATYSAAVLDDIRAGVDIVDFVGRFVNLKKAGANWKGLCPFHGEKTPSFMVNPKKGIFHCFGCGVGGDVFGFLMRQDRLSFPEAVRALAKSAGVALPEERGGQPGDSGREELFRAIDLAARFYAEMLWTPAGERAQKYLVERGIDPEVARRFGLGYAPEGWDRLADFMRSEKVGEDTLVAAGLAVQRENRGGSYDRFRNRLLFTIRDLQSRVVAFGGRAFGDDQPKYLNSPETPLYTKGNLLYAADVARETMRAKNRALIVEGYVDCLMAHQHGFTETVAALGTAFTPAQLALLRRYCDEVVTFFDADAAGQAATLSREAASRLGVDATQLWFEAQRLSASLRKPPAPVGKATTAGPTSADDKKLVTKLVTLLLVDLEARTVLLPLLEPSDVVHPVLREIVETLKRLPTTPATALLAELASDEARHMLAALVVEDTTTPDPRASIEHFRRRLEFLGGRRRVRDLSRSIGAAQASQGVHAPVDDDLLAVQRDSARVYQHQGGSAQVVDRAVDHPHPMGPDGPQGVQGHE